MVQRQADLFLGIPRLLLPSGAQVNAVKVCSLAFVMRMWPINLERAAVNLFTYGATVSSATDNKFITTCILNFLDTSCCIPLHVAELHFSHNKSKYSRILIGSFLSSIGRQKGR